MMRNLLLVPCLLAVLPAQNPVTVTIPNQAPVNVDVPWSSGIGRYQQWYSATAVQTGLGEPRRIERLEFFAGTAPTSTPAQINCEILMAHGQFSGLTASFAANYFDSPVVVKPVGNVALVAGASGAVVINIPLTTMFTWDGVHPIVVEIRVLGNSNSNQPFAYNFRGGTPTPPSVHRLYAAGNASASSGTMTQGFGINTRFTARQGALVPFGTGCPGEGGFVPVGTAQQVPQPAITWNHQLSNAASQRIALWVIGDSTTAWETLPLPLDLTALLGFPSSSCRLRTNPVNIIATVTVGGGAGGGLATVPVPLPATTNYVGLSVFTQWVVLDPLAPNGVLSATAGLRAIVAPVGG